MKHIFYSQRVEVMESYGERRDCADQRIAEFITACGYLPFPLPNLVDNIDHYFSYAKPDGILLTGGNSLAAFGGNAPEKDAVDRRIIECSIEYQVPLFGFCRGMQSILDYFSVELEQVKGHAGVRHSITGNGKCSEVNSYHNQGARKDNGVFEVTGTAMDGVIEAVRHKILPIMAVMWHPEREAPFRFEDMELVKQHFK